MPQDHVPQKSSKRLGEESLDINKQGISSMRTAMFGLAGVCVAMLLKVLEMKPWDRSLTIALYCFIIAIPLLTALAIVLDIQEDPRWTKMSWKGFSLEMTLNLGNGAFMVGFTSFLWHFSASAGVVFLAATTVALVCFIWFQKEVGDGSKPSGNDWIEPQANRNLPQNKSE